MRDGRRVLASEMILDAISCTLWKWPSFPRIEWSEKGYSGELAMVTFVNPDKVRRKREPGRCFIKAGFRKVGRTKGGLISLGLDVEDLPPPHPCTGSQVTMWGPGPEVAR